MDALRLCALALHAVAGRDRAWLLSRLPAAQRQPLTALLDELRGCGIAADVELVHQLARERDLLAPRPAQSAATARLSRASAQAVWALLRGEPDTVVSRVVRCHAWPWQAALMALCGPDRAKRVELLRARLKPAVALEQALVDELAQRLATAPTADRPRPPRWRFLRRDGGGA